MEVVSTTIGTFLRTADEISITKSKLFLHTISETPAESPIILSIYVEGLVSSVSLSKFCIVF
jgi:hypothetical protein